MTLYEINNMLMELIDAETGEIKDYEAFEKLNIDRDDKIENTALWIKNLGAESVAIGNEIKSFIERKKAIDKKIETLETLETLLSRELSGNKFTTARVNITWRKSKQVQIDDSFIEWAQTNNRDDLLKFSKPTADKEAIKKAIIDGQTINGAKYVDKNNMSVK